MFSISLFSDQGSVQKASEESVSTQQEPIASEGLQASAPSDDKEASAEEDNAAPAAVPAVAEEDNDVPDAPAAVPDAQGDAPADVAAEDQQGEEEDEKEEEEVAAVVRDANEDVSGR